MTKLLGALLLMIAAVAAVIGAGWVSLDAIGTEWDYCPGGSDCIAGWKMGVGFIVAAIVAAIAGFFVIRSE
jgi:hypothetical protein